jgi:hypothetical protein
MAPLTTVIDVDGVLYDWAHHLGDAAARILSRPRHDFPPAVVWDFYKEQWGMTSAELVDLVDVAVADHGFLREGDPFADALEGFDLLRCLGATIHIVTHIGTDGDPNGHRAARAHWLESQGFAFDALTFTPDKAAVARSYVEQGHRVFALEDNVENYRALRDCGARSYLLDQEWNRFELCAPRVSSVLAFAQQVAAAVTN